MAWLFCHDYQNHHHFFLLAAFAALPARIAAIGAGIAAKRTRCDAVEDAEKDTPLPHNRLWGVNDYGLLSLSKEIYKVAIPLIDYGGVNDYGDCLAGPRKDRRRGRGSQSVYLQSVFL